MALGLKKLLKKVIVGDSPKAEEELSAKEPTSSSKVAADKKAASSDESKSSIIKKEKTTKKPEKKVEAANKQESAESTSNLSKEKSSMNTIQHKYLEVSADLLAKPSALCDLVEAQGGQSTLVFCNNPSDADFVEVILKKRGISALKLIGFVAAEKLSSTQDKIKSGEIQALVVTDVAARGADLSLFPVVINYSLPADLDNYSSRVGADQAGERTVFSIVGPSDFANLHSLKSQTNFELSQAEAPGKEDLAKAKLVKLKVSAQAKYTTINASLVELAKQVLADKDAEQIVSLLVQQSIEIIPQLQSQVEKLTWEKENKEDDEDHQQGYSSQPSRGNYRDDGRGRNQRRDGRDRDQGRDQRRGGNENRGRNDDYRDNSERSDQDFSSDEAPQRNNRRHREERGPAPIKIRDDRIYIGKGQKDGFSKEEFVSLMKEKCELDGEQLKRFLLRKNYCFADLAEGVATDVIAKLDGVESKAGNLYVAKATQVITVVENQNPEQQYSEQDQDNNDGEDSSDEQQPAA
jgi:superfamily II DNA/RNA helicase